MNCLLIFFLLTGECFHSGPGLTILRSASIILRKFCPLCYKHLRECSLFMGRGGGGLTNGETERLELFVPPQLEHVNVFDPPPPPPPLDGIVEVLFVSAENVLNQQFLSIC